MASVPQLLPRPVASSTSMGSEVPSPYRPFSDVDCRPADSVSWPS